MQDETPAFSCVNGVFCHLSRFCKKSGIFDEAREAKCSQEIGNLHRFSDSSNTKSNFLFQESVDLIDDIKEKLEELKVEVQGSPLPTEVRKMFRMFIVFNKSKKENPIFRLF